LWFAVRATGQKGGRREPPAGSVAKQGTSSSASARVARYAPRRCSSEKRDRDGTARPGRTLTGERGHEPGSEFRAAVSDSTRKRSARARRGQQRRGARLGARRGRDQAMSWYSTAKPFPPPVGLAVGFGREGVPGGGIAASPLGRREAVAGRRPDVGSPLPPMLQSSEPRCVGRDSASRIEGVGAPAPSGREQL
jgi:hypothetical protein